MAFLKRKRSESEFSCSSSSTLSSPPRPDGLEFGSMVTPIPYGRTPSHLSSRTLKRFRNSRPAEEDVHEKTLRLLYSARQQQQQQPPPRYIHAMPSESTPSQAPASHGQKSLHAFWNIPSSESQAMAPPSTVDKAAYDAANNRTDCEDCGAAVNGGEDDSVMEIDGAVAVSGCVSCGKTVCTSCSVSNLGEDTRCLVCAGRGNGRKESGLAPNIGSMWKRLGVF